MAGDTLGWSLDPSDITPFHNIVLAANPLHTEVAINFFDPGTVNLTVVDQGVCGTFTTPTIPITVNSASSTLAADGTPGTTCTVLQTIFGWWSYPSDNNCNTIAAIGATAPSADFGSVKTCVTVDASVQSYNGIPYVRRHYNIEPQVNTSTATAIVQLYFTQADFDAYNAVRGSNPALPTNPLDAAGVANLRVTQFHGTGTTPGTYVGGSGEINPDDNNIAWNAAANRWEVTFNITGFSGFFVSTGSLIPLPLTLTDFSGQTTENGNALQWTTSQEQNTAYFEIQRNTNNSFTGITTIPAAGNSHLPLHYQYTDNTTSHTSYRLKMVDLDGASTYSKIITLGQPGTYTNSILVSPNPLHNSGTLTITAATAGKSTILITDTRGRQVYQQQFTLAKGINTLPASMTSSLPYGTYLLIVWMDKQRFTTKFVRY